MSNKRIKYLAMHSHRHGSDYHFFEVDKDKGTVSTGWFSGENTSDEDREEINQFVPDINWENPSEFVEVVEVPESFTYIKR